jgi:hypothetical protein
VSQQADLIILAAYNRCCNFNVYAFQGFKINQTFVSMKIIPSMAAWFNKWLSISLIPLFMGLSGNKISFSPTNVVAHPFHVSVTEINHNAVDKTLEITCKIYRDDFEKILATNYKTKVDLINPVDRKAMEKLVNDYVQKHLIIKADSKPLSLSGIGFEFEDEAIFSYFQVDNVSSVKSIALTNSILFDLFDDQLSIMHITVGGNRKSNKLNYPAKDIVVNF